MTTSVEPVVSAPVRRRVLVVEDEPHIRELVALHLGLEGLAVTEVGSGDEAIRRSETEAYDLVVLDLDAAEGGWRGRLSRDSTANDKCRCADPDAHRKA